MTSTRIEPASPHRPATRLLPRAAALGLALGLCALAPCCPAPAPAAPADPGVTITEPAAPVNDAEGEGTREAEAANTGNPADCDPTPAGEDADGVGDDAGGFAADEAAETDVDPEASGNAEDAAETTGAAEGANGEEPDARDHDVTAEAARPAGTEDSADPMEVLLAVVRQRQAEGFPVTVEMADPVTGRVVYGAPSA